VIAAVVVVDTTRVLATIGEIMTEAEHTITTAVSLHAAE
jgi:hypothetical protein